MKARVLVRFKDKHNGKVYAEGDIITVSKARFAEILTVGELVEAVEEPKKAKAED